MSTKIKTLYRMWNGLYEHGIKPYYVAQMGHIWLMEVMPWVWDAMISDMEIGNQIYNTGTVKMRLDKLREHVVKRPQLPKGWRYSDNHMPLRGVIGIIGKLAIRVNANAHEPVSIIGSDNYSIVPDEGNWEALTL